MNLIRVLACALAVLLAVTVPACGGDEGSSGDATEPFELALDFYVNPDHAGIYTGLERGFFEAEGLTVNPRVPSDPSAPIRQVAAGQVDAAISYEPEVLLAREQGLDVVAIAALVDRPLTSLISLPEAGIESPADLAGKTVATAGIPYQAEFLAAIVEDAGVAAGDVDRVDVGLGLLPAVLSGEADAMLGGFRNIEGVDLAERGRDPRVVPVDRAGIPTYDELVVVAATDRVTEDPEPLRAFLRALERGTRAAAADPEAAAATVLEAGDGLDPELTRAEVEATLPLLLGRGSDEPFGWMDEGEWERFASFFGERGLLTRVPPAKDVLTNDLLPASD